ncbi:MAG: carboxypeptidase-like regulatory domain-containing protein [Candidatus Kapabacteria bacterium]|nr:carboxypeptidase-like regulatory domain-containing protein [Candidatus Kapabacteria bacterium]
MERDARGIVGARHAAPLVNTYGARHAAPLHTRPARACNSPRAGSYLAPCMHIILALLLVVTALPAQNDGRVMYTGTIVDSATGAGISGASIRVAGTSMGTYAGSRGTFRLPLPPGPHVLEVRSIGYGEVRQSIDPASTTLRIALPVSAVDARIVKVLGDISAQEVVRRATARRDVNAKRITTLERNLYSKLRVDAKNKGLLADKEDDAGVITETFSRVYEQRQPAPGKKQTIILQRRQTKNISAASNLAVFDEEFDVSQDNFELLNVKLTSPLSPAALDDYNFTIVNKRQLGTYLAYELSFAPKSRLFPGFEGTMTIVDGSYQLVESDFAPTQETAIPFIKGFRIKTRYEQVADSIWVPAYQELSGKLRLKIIAGLADLEVGAAATSWLQDAKANQPIDDSIFKRQTKPADTSGGAVSVEAGGGAVTASASLRSNVTVMPDADSAKSEYWDKHAFAELSEQERETYRKQDSIAADTTKKTSRSDSAARRSAIGLFSMSLGPVNLGINPLINRTGVTGVMYGAQLEVNSKPVRVLGAASFGEQGTRAGSVDVRVPIVGGRKASVDAAARVFSDIYSIQASRDILQRFSNLNLSNLLYADYADFYRRDGFDVGVKASLGEFSLALLAESSRHFTMPLIETLNREQVVPNDGAYRTLFASIGTGEENPLASLLGGGRTINGSVTVGYGEQVPNSNAFRSVSANLALRLNTFDVGYSPMRLDLALNAGWTSANTPRQYQYSAMRRYPVFGMATDMMTIPINRLGGTEFLRVHAEHNFSDLWWRAIGLPTYNGRGLDLLATGAAASYVQRGIPLATAFRSTDGWYTEAGFALARIPSFISDLFFLRVDMRWPVGPIARPAGTFGWSVSISSPLL